MRFIVFALAVCALAGASPAAQPQTPATQSAAPVTAIRWVSGG